MLGVRQDYHWQQILGDMIRVLFSTQPEVSQVSYNGLRAKKYIRLDSVVTAP